MRIGVLEEIRQAGVWVPGIAHPSPGFQGAQGLVTAVVTTVGVRGGGREECQAPTAVPRELQEMIMK